MLNYGNWNFTTRFMMVIGFNNSKEHRISLPGSGQLKIKLLNSAHNSTLLFG